MIDSQDWCIAFNRETRHHILHTRLNSSTEQSADPVDYPRPCCITKNVHNLRCLNCPNLLLFNVEERYITVKVCSSSFQWNNTHCILMTLNFLVTYLTPVSVTVSVSPKMGAGLNDGLFSETMDFRDFPSVLSAVRIAQS